MGVGVAMAGKRRARMVSGLSRGPMKKASKERRKELWGTSAAGPEQLPGPRTPSRVEPASIRWRLYLWSVAMLSRRNHIMAAYRRHLAGAGGNARRNRIDQAVGMRKKAPIG
jgi:hypothetical protein